MTLKAITVFGSAQPAPDSRAYEQARTLGQLLAQAGFAVINGGYAGTMQAVSQGASENGGQAIGITCAVFDGERLEGNIYLTKTIHTPDLLARLKQLTELGDGFVVLGGGVGTLLELFLVWNLLAMDVFQKPCVLVGKHWQSVIDALERETNIEPRHSAMLSIVDTPQQAVATLVAVRKGAFVF
jgi:uncharacterized protein (TIGR00730 family)